MIYSVYLYTSTALIRQSQQFYFEIPRKDVSCVYISNQSKPHKKLRSFQNSTYTTSSNLLSTLFSSSYGLWCFILFPISPLSHSHGTHPYPSSSSTSFSHSYWFLAKSLFALWSYARLLFQSDSIFPYRTTLSVFAPIKAIWFVSRRHFLQSEISVWVLERGCFLFGLDPIKSRLAP